MPRKYEPIWRNLKDTGKCCITCPNLLHPRIIKAVKKEKDKDVGYKLLLSEEGRKARLSISENGAMVTFRLIKSIGVEDL